MSRKLFVMTAAVAFAVVLAAGAGEANAGLKLFGGGDCCAPAPSCAAPKCCKPAKVKCCKPAKVKCCKVKRTKCCKPAKSCCAPAPTCCAPAPSCCAPSSCAPSSCAPAAGGAAPAPAVEEAPAPPPAA